MYMNYHRQLVLAFKVNGFIGNSCWWGTVLLIAKNMIIIFESSGLCSVDEDLFVFTASC